MNSFHSLKLLTPELKSKLRDLRFQGSSTPSRLTWVGEFASREQEASLTFCAMPDATALFLRDGNGPVRRRNTKRFFEELAGERVLNVRMAEADRFLWIEFESGKSLEFTLFGPRANVVLRSERKIGPDPSSESESSPEADQPSESFRKFDPPRPGAPRRPTAAAPAPHAAASGSERAFPASETVSEPARIIQALLEEDPKLSRRLLKRVVQGPLHARNFTRGDLHELARTWGRAMLERPEFCVLSDGTCCLLPSDLLPSDWLDAETMFKAEDANDMIRYAFTRTAAPDRLNVRIERVRTRLEALIRKREHTLGQMAREEKTLARADRSEQLGHILLAHPRAEPAGGECFVRLPDLFADGEPVQIPVDPDKTMAENAADYYNRSVKGRRRADSLQERRIRVQAEIRELNEAAEQLASVRSAKDLKRWESRIGAERLTERPASPYKQVDMDGYRVWIGRNAKSNDRVLADSHKEDLWMHARGVGGSHVVVRMGGSKQMPPAELLEQAAGAAAWFSQDRGSSVVPVSVTRRKYVVKPKGAPAGAVKILNEQQVLHVNPTPPPDPADPSRSA